MATLRKRRSKWYARIRIWDNNIRKEREIQIPLNTKSRVAALERLSFINQYESDLRNGLSFTFPWENTGGQLNLKRFTINDAINEWMDRRLKIGVRASTLEINQNGLDHFTDAVGGSCPLEAVTVKKIDAFVDYLQFKGLSVSSINMHLRTVKAMLRYYWKRERLDRVPLIEQLKQEENNPIYITDNEFQSIMELEWLDEFYKRVFYFYRETGCRIREPFISKLDGNWLDIPNLSKGKKPRNLELAASVTKIFTELSAWLGSGYGSALADPADHISKKFKQALRSIGADESKRFHSLRHTFAVRRIVEKVPIFKIQKMMGHSSIATTEGYLKLDLKRLERDFPTIVYNPSKSAFRDTDFRDTDGKYLEVTESRMIN